MSQGNNLRCAFLQIERADAIHYMGTGRTESSQALYEKAVKKVEDAVDKLKMWPSNSFAHLEHFDTRIHFAIYMKNMRQVGSMFSLHLHYFVELSCSVALICHGVPNRTSKTMRSPSPRLCLSTMKSTTSSSSG